MNTKISYLYRDADNYKRYNECIVAGTLSANQICTILDCCDMGEYFIPGQVGLPERRFDPYDPQADHVVKSNMVYSGVQTWHTIHSLVIFR